MIIGAWARLRRRLSSSPSAGIADAILDAWRRRNETGPAVWTRLGAQLLATADQVEIVALCRAVHALSKLGHASPALLDHIAARSIHLPPVSSSFLVDLADTFARARRFDHDLFRTVSLRLATPDALVGRLSPGRASLLLYSCARVGFADARLFGVVSQDLLAQVDVMPPVFVSRLAWALARARLATATRSCTTLARALLSRALASDPATFAGPTTIATDLLWAYAVIGDAIGRRPHARQLVGQLGPGLRGRLGRASPHSLASFVWAAATLDADLPADLLADVIAVGADLVPICRSNSCLAILAWSLVQLRLPCGDVIGAVAALGPERWAQFRPPDLAMLVTAVAALNDDARFDTPLLQMADAALVQLDDFDAVDLCALLGSLSQGLGQARRRRPLLFDGAARRLERNLDQLSASDRALLLSVFLDGRDDRNR